MSVDWTKPVQFRDLPERKIVFTKLFDANSWVLIIYIISGREYVEQRPSDGRFHSSAGALDVINVPELATEVWCSYSKHGDRVGTYETMRDAVHGWRSNSRDHVRHFVEVLKDRIDL